MEDFNKMFEDFCEKYGFEYDFTRLGEYAYINYSTQKAFLIWSKASGIGA